MTPTDVKAMTAIVRAILRGKWTDEAPDWATWKLLQECGEFADGTARAIQTAETFIMLCDSCHYPLDVERFLTDCGFNG